MFSFLEGDLKFYWLCAIFGAMVFVILMAFSFFGGHGGEVPDGDTTTEHPDAGVGFQLFSFRSAVAFVTFFGWGGVIYGKGGPAGFLVALACGILMMFVTASAFYFMMRMEQSGNIHPKDYVNCTGKVYLSIPGGRTAPGKISVTVRGCLREIEAVSDEELPTGTAVTVVSHVEGQRFLVRKI